MKSSSIVALAAGVVVLGGCNILEMDNYAEPTSVISGRVVFEGQPVGVRSNGVQLELWQPGFELNQKIPVHVAQDGSFTAVVFDGNYEINLLANNGPWVSNTTRIPLTLNGTASIDVPVEPFFVIRNEQFAFNPAGGGPNGTISATFNVRRVNATRQLEYVGLYIANNNFVDRIAAIPIPNPQRERTGAQVQTQLANNQPITITYQLPANIYLTGSPARRDKIYVRVGAKTLGVAEMLFSPVYEIPI
jgi:hypothetical protein